jgi:predicted nucleic acid-binding protein
MADKFIVDTNIFLRYIIKDNEGQYQKAEKWLRKANKKQIDLIVFPQVIFEINYVLLKIYNFDKKEVVDILKEIVLTPYLKVINREVLLLTIKKYRKINISLIDIYLYFQAKNRNAQILSFDEDFNKL